MAILGLKNKGVVKICRIQGDLLVCGGLNFPGEVWISNKKKHFHGIGKYQFSKNFACGAGRTFYFTLIVN